MDFEDFVEPEIAITAAVAAALFSPRARGVMRKGLVYGVAGVLAAGDAVTSFGQSVRQGMQHAGEVTAQMTRDGGGQGQEEEGETVQESTPPAVARRKPATKSGKAKGKPA